MTEVFSHLAGDSPLLVSIPHDGRALMPGQEERMTSTGRALPDTDWHVQRLYRFATELGASVVAANYSRYVVDLNRPADDSALYGGQIATGLCPLRTFAGEDIYSFGESVSAEEQSSRVRDYWRPYHDTLQQTISAIRAHFGYALLWDAHSIATEVPLLFDGHLPDLNVGTNGGQTAAPGLETAVMAVAHASPYSSVLNGRFKGGHITRCYGNPENGVHAIQLELAQHTYMDEKSLEFDEERAPRLRSTIRDMLVAFQTDIPA